MSSADAARLAELLIIADDLTGTADSAVGCAERGLATQVTLSTTLPAPTDAVAVDLDSRACPAEEAAKRHRDCLRGWQGRFGHLFKKVDSTLRGNVAAEIAALVPFAGMAIVAPAYPATGRTTRDGRQWLDDVPVEATEVWRNEGITGRADLAGMLQGAGLETRRLDRGALHADAADVVRRLREWQQAGVDAVICDATAQTDLERIAALTVELERVFWVGAAGLGIALPDALGLDGAAMPPAIAAEASYRPTLIAIGSMSRVSHAQADALAAALPAIEVIEIEAAALLAPAALGERQRLSARLNDTLAAGRDVMVRLAQPENRDAREGAALSEALGTLIAPHLSLVSRLIATGGATARAILTSAAIHRLILLDAPEHGMARLAVADRQPPLEVITKAGGFGDAEALVRLWRRRVNASTSGTPASESRPDPLLSRNDPEEFTR